ncbi:MAG: nucleotidyltransferase family protein [Candidatus Saganbacteria bacterium]|nr:nucleotidyltransferase family protein [Candidatus Saganbacteria bacterium]
MSKREDQILLLCGRVVLGEAEKKSLKNLLENKVNFDLLISKASCNQIPYLLYRHLKDFRNQVPVDVFERLKSGYVNNLVRSLMIFEEHKKIQTLFELEEIPVLPLKGPVFAELVYGDMGLRPTSDIDVLVKDKDVEKARQILIKNGYTDQGGIPEYNLEYARKYRIHMLFNGKFLVELHWHVCPEHKYKLKEESLWKNTREYSIQGEKITALSPEGMLIHFFYHGLGSSFFKSLVDISEVLKRFGPEIDWASLDADVSSGNLKNAAFYFLSAAHKLLGAPFYDDRLKKRRFGIRNFFVRKMVPPELMISKNSNFLRQLLILCLVDTLGDAFYIMKYELFPPTEIKKLEKKHGR